MAKLRKCAVCGILFEDETGQESYCPECKRVKSAVKAEFQASRRRYAGFLKDIHARENRREIRNIAKEAMDNGMSYGQYMAKIKWEHDCKTCPMQTEPKEHREQMCEECREELNERGHDDAPALGFCHCAYGSAQG